MFVGHYGPAAALKAATPRVPLWHFFIAVQFLDYVWAIFILTGVEHARVVPGFLAASDLDLYDMPYTHSLVGAALWSLGGAALYRFLNRAAGRDGAMLIGLAIFSHWIADLLVHAPDLSLFPGSATRIGLGLWSSIAGSQLLEAGTAAAGLVLYAGATQPKGLQGKLSLLALIAAFAVLQAYNLVAPAPPAIEGVAVAALIAYSLFAALAFWVDRTRAMRRAAAPAGRP